MRFKLLVIGIAIILLPALAILTTPVSISLAQTDGEPIRIEVSRHGFNQTPGEFRLEVEAGQEVVITFVYGDGDQSDNNPHRIFITGYNIFSAVLDRGNQESTVRFTANETGEVSFMCVLSCVGHDNLQKGTITIQQATKPLEEKEETSSALLSLVAEQSLSGQSLSLKASLRNSQDKPIVNAPVKFLIKVDFFTTGLIEIGEAVTDDEGVAVLEYIPRQTGDVEVLARYKGIETTGLVSIGEGAKTFYQAETGLHSEVSWPEVFVGPQSALEPGEGGAAPVIGIRIPGGLPSLLLLAYILTIIMVWSFYIRVMYQVFRIPSEVARGTGNVNIRLVPLTGMTVMLILVTLLVLILITGLYSHPHILH